MDLTRVRIVKNELGSATQKELRGWRVHNGMKRRTGSWEWDGLNPQPSSILNPGSECGVIISKSAMIVPCLYTCITLTSWCLPISFPYTGLYVTTERNIPSTAPLRYSLDSNNIYPGILWGGAGAILIILLLSLLLLSILLLFFLIKIISFLCINNSTVGTSTYPTCQELKKWEFFYPHRKLFGAYIECRKFKLLWTKKKLKI